MERTRVCLYLERWSSGGIEAFIYNTLCASELSGFEIDIVASKIENSIFTDRLKALGVGFIELSGRLRSGENERLFRKLLREKKYHTLHLHIFHGLSLKLLKIAKEEGVGVRIAHSHGAGLRKCTTRPLKLLIHSVGKGLWLGYATNLLACSPEAARFLFGRMEAVIIKNGIKTEAFAFSEEARAKKRAELQINGTLLGNVGRLSAEKNQLFLLDVYKEYRELHPDSRLIIVGDGEMKTEIEKKAERLGIGDGVIMYGEAKEIPELLSAMDIFLFPSAVEGLGIAAIEAQASGLPVITSEGVPESARLGPRAVKLKTDSAAEWSEEIDRLISEDYDRSDAYIEVKKQGFDAAVAGEKILALYK